MRDPVIAGNTIWVVVAAVLVMFMQAGFAFLEAGMTAHGKCRARRRQEHPDVRTVFARVLGGGLWSRVWRR